MDWITFPNDTSHIFYTVLVVCLLYYVPGLVGVTPHSQKRISCLSFNKSSLIVWKK